ncbi:MAG: DUF6273 domain-containing protein, partial [Eggerthellales bacterium]|nr:DUF6273 domain-containing protein [Eggerthellales bacterium]
MPLRAMTASGLGLSSNTDQLILANEFDLGTYEGQPIKWRILSLEGSQALCISTRTLSQRPFADRDGQGSQSRAEADQVQALTWENSSLRAWLNGEFLSDAFGEQAECLLEYETSDRETSDHEAFEPAPGKSCMDKVFCLSIQEAQQLFATDVHRAALVREGINGTWWLRSLGDTAGHKPDQPLCATVFQTGWINPYGNLAQDGSVGVRPAILVDLSLMTLELDASSESDSALAHPDFASALLASQVGEELLLEACETGDYSLVGQVCGWLGTDAAW